MNINDFYFYRIRPILNVFGLGQITFSQDKEDVIVLNTFKSLGIHIPSYIDIGANDPFLLSNTALLYKNGSSGVNIEPDPTLIGKFIVSRERDINLNIGITDTDGEMDFYVMSANTLSTFSQSEAQRLKDNNLATIDKVIKIKTCNIKSVISKYCNGVFPDFLSIDTEGYELQILGTIDWNSSYPKVICCETATFGIEGRDIELIDWIKGKEYNVVAHTAINTIFLHKTLCRWCQHDRYKKH